MTAYQTAQRFGFTGTPAEIVAKLKGIKIHRRNVYITGGPSDTASVNLLHLLVARYRVMGMGPNQNWVGALPEMEADNPEVAYVMNIMRGLLQVNDTQVYCAEVDEAADMLNALTAIVGSLTGKPAEVAADVAVLSGGRIGSDYDSLTPGEYAAEVEDATEAATDAARREVEEGAISQAVAAMQQLWSESPVTTKQQLIDRFVEVLTAHWGA